MRRFVWLTVCGAVLIAADAPRDDLAQTAGPQGELGRFQGTWQLIAAQSNGEPAPEERIKGVRVTIAGSAHTVRFGDQVIAHDVTFAIDPSKKPKETTDTISDGANPVKQIRGIYNIEGDTLISCVAGVDKDRPTEFSATAGSGWTLRVFRRVKADAAVREAAIAGERKKFNGTWRFASVEAGGKPLPWDGFREAKLILTEAHFTSVEPQSTSRGIYSVDPTATPKTIDVVFTEGPYRGEILLGVYELEGDTYKVCIGEAGKPRPAGFVSKPGSGHVLEVLKREKPAN